MGPAKDPKADFQQEDVIQAVLVADGFHFGPLSQDVPPALVPLVNTPLIDYTIQLLLSSGVKDIVIVSASPAIKSHVDSHWSTLDYRITHLVSESVASVGDALREVDKSGLVKNDFVLVTGNVVSNGDLAPAIKAHKALKAEDKQMAMTLIFRRGLQGTQRSQSAEAELLVAVNASSCPSSHKILHFQRSQGNSSLHVPVSVFQENDNVELRYDLLDPGIAICSPIVPQIFSDDFDYLTRDDFVKGLLVHQELMGNSLYLTTLDGAYAACASDLGTYSAISHDVLARWSFPLTPDLFPSAPSASPYQYFKGGVYRSSSVSVGNNTTFGHNVYLGQGSHISDGVNIRNSIIGKGCTVGANSVLDGVIMFEGSSVGCNCHLKTSIIGSLVTVGDNVNLDPGCVLGSKVVVGNDVKLTSGTELTMAEDFADNDFSASLGKGGQGFRFQSDIDDDEDEVEDQVSKLAEALWWQARINEDKEEESDEEESEDEEDDEDEEMVDEEEDEEMKDLKHFYHEVIDTLLRGVEENISSDNLVLEINSLKQAYFIYISEVQQSVVKAIVEAPATKLGLRGKPLLLHVRKHGFPLLKNYIKDGEAQGLALTALMKLCDAEAESPDSQGLSDAVRTILMPLLKLLYNDDLITESEVVFEWFKAQDDDTKKLFLPFVKELQEAEDEDDDDDDDSD